MMKRVVLFVLIVLVGGVVCASTIPTNLPEYKAVVRSRADKVRSISDEAKFYLVTCEPGEEVYARFGHSGIRVYDPVTGIDEVFHWGLFSFDTPNFIGRFISGNTDYEMGVFGTKYFMREYIQRGSSVYAQELNLTAEQFARADLDGDGILAAKEALRILQYVSGAVGTVDMRG